MQRCEGCGEHETTKVEFKARDFAWSRRLCTKCKELNIFQLQTRCARRMFSVFPGCYAPMRLWEFAEFYMTVMGEVSSASDAHAAG